MFKEIKTQYKVNEGYTLFEIIIVIVIIGTIAAFAIPKFTKSVERTKTTEAIQILDALKSAQIVYQLETGSYTTNLTLLDVDIPTSPNFNSPTLGSTAASLASIQRTLSNAYTLSIDDTGIISCTGSDCQEIGCTYGAGNDQCNN
ncbi:MAG: prepilin-type N-terminal cleavage/methylation domain-containing protein [Candidatus Omnitrophica bacterium]|nr:prepilin-type N-terminal cleavage/methylation domain-containing protein [Candidatus Omnitrophota bacterium]MCB9748246.1 prepilin-type N-terminal cleavage/methylation domain-containing protein [Candidatus Omnitrophota bacterium]